MKETQAVVERIKQVNLGYQRIELSVDESLLQIKPGQSILARLSDTWDPYLRQQWFPVNLLNGKLIVERPIAEAYEVGQVIHVLGIIGQPFRFRKTLRNVLLVAYDTAPTPLLMTIPWLLANKVSVTIALLGVATQYDTQHLPPEVEVELGDNDSEFLWQNQVMTLGWADQVFVTVGPDNEFSRFANVIDRVRELRHDVPRHYLFGVFQQLLPCGAGACHSCMIRTEEGTALICLEGPAFDLTQVKLT